MRHFNILILKFVWHFFKKKKKTEKAVVFVFTSSISIFKYLGFWWETPPRGIPSSQNRSSASAALQQIERERKTLKGKSSTIWRGRDGATLNVRYQCVTCPYKIINCKSTLMALKITCAAISCKRLNRAIQIMCHLVWIFSCPFIPNKKINF